jgi:hypothetical protein
MILLGAGRLSAKGERVCQHRTLSHGIHLIVPASERRHYQGPSGYARGVSHGGDQNIQLVSLIGKRRQSCRDHNGSYILQLDRAGIGRDTHTFQYIYDRLDLNQYLTAVAAAAKAHDQTVTYQLVLAHPIEGSNILDSNGMGIGSQK